LALGTEDQFIDTTIMDWILCMSPELDSTTDFMPTHCHLYSDTLRNASTTSGGLATREALEAQLVTMLSEASTDKYASTLKIKYTATRLLFIWNPSGVHFVLVVADAPPEGLTMYDSYNGDLQRHPTTWRYVDLLRFHSS
jgi:hypothetical protein